MRKNWGVWRPIVEGMATYTEMSTMGIDEVMEFNAAIDYHIMRKNEARQKGGGGG